MKLPRRLFAIAMLALALIFASSQSPPVYAADNSFTQVQIDNSGTVPATAVDMNTVAFECQSRADWVRESVGKELLIIKVRTFEPVKELAGYRQKVRTKPKATAYTGISNTRAREQV